MARATILLFLFAFFSSPSTGKRMRWIPNVDLNNPDNWEPRGAPCRNDHVMFPAKAPPVYVQTNQTLLELVLPNDGEIILAEGSTLTFPDTADSSCIGKSVLFVGVTPKSWFDTVNWCVTSESSVDCLTAQPDLLDTERIPCQSDDVVFAVGTSFFVDLQSGAAVRIANLKLGNEQMNTETFRSYLESESGRKQFIGQNGSNVSPTTVTIGGPVCTDVTGCTCGNLRSSNRVCVFQSNRCAQVSCRGAILPDGHCCHICGAVLSLDYGAGFKLSNLKNLVTDTFRRLSVSPDAVKTIISKLDDDQIQVVLELTTDDGGGGAAEVGRSLKDDLEKDPRYGAVRVSLNMSESNSPEAHTGDKASGSMSSGAIVGLIFVILLIVIALLAAFYFYRNRHTCNRPKFPEISFPEISFPSPPDFQRFFRSKSGRGRTSDVGIELSQQSVSFDNRSFEGNLSGFENPTYGDLFTTLQSGSSTQSIGGSEKSGFSNPMYATTTETSTALESKEPSHPDYILYDVPPKEPSRKDSKRGPEVGQTKDGSSTEPPPERTDTLGRKLMGQFRLVTSKLRRTRLEEEQEEENPVKPTEERPAREDTTVGGEQPPEAEKKRARMKFGRTHDHERLEETGDDGDGEVEERKETKTVNKRAVEEATAGFGNPLYGADDGGAVVDMDLGEAGTTGSGSAAAAADRTRRSRAGFENPLFEDSKEKPRTSDENRSVSVAGATEAEDESRA